MIDITPLDQIGNRLLTSAIRSNLNPIIEQYIFEVNDHITRRHLQADVGRYLATLQNRSLIHDYVVNIPFSVDDITNHRLTLDVHVQPAPAVEFIHLRFVAEASGATFDELREEEEDTKITLEDIKKLDHFKDYEERFKI